MKKKKKIIDIIKARRIEIILISLFLVAGVYMFCLNKSRNHYLNGSEVSYSIGKIKEVKFGAKVSPSFYYEFYINAKLIEGKSNVGALRGEGKSFLRSMVGDYYLVKFSTKKNKFNILLTDKKVPDSLSVNCLKCSWDKVPF